MFRATDLRDLLKHFPDVGEFVITTHADPTTEWYFTGHAVFSSYPTAHPEEARVKLYVSTTRETEDDSRRRRLWRLISMAIEDAEDLCANRPELYPLVDAFAEVEQVMVKLDSGEI